MWAGVPARMHRRPRRRVYDPVRLAVAFGVMRDGGQERSDLGSAGVVTGDAVIVEVQIAQLPVRAVGAVIDVLVISIASIVGTVLSAAAIRQFDDALGGAFSIIFAVLSLVGYPAIFETATRGRSLGKDGDGPAGGIR